MKPSISIPPGLVGDDRMYADHMADLIIAAGTFADANDLSSWLHRQHPNPRVRYSSEPDLRSLRIHERGCAQALLIIHLVP